MNLKRFSVLAFALAICSPLEVLAQAGFTTTCQVKTGAVYARTYEDLLAREGASVVSACQYVSTSPQFALIAGTKASSANRIHDEYSQNQCNLGNARYCEYIYRSQWQATCCGRISL